VDSNNRFTRYVVCLSVARGAIDPRDRHQTGNQQSCVDDVYDYPKGSTVETSNSLGIECVYYCVNCIVVTLYCSGV
jgi:hypothetical protein